MSEPVSSWLVFDEIIFSGVTFLHGSVEVDTVPWLSYANVPVVRHPEEHTKAESQFHLSTNVVIIERLVKPISVSE